MDCSLLASSVHGILQARILEWVAISFSRGSYQPRDQTWISCIAGRFFTAWATKEDFFFLEKLWSDLCGAVELKARTWPLWVNLLKDLLRILKAQKHKHLQPGFSAVLFNSQGISLDFYKLPVVLMSNQDWEPLPEEAVKSLSVSNFLWPYEL